jgi:hypothetical protein
MRLETAADYLMALNAISMFKAVTIQTGDEGVLISLYAYRDTEEYAEPDDEIEGEDLYEAIQNVVDHLGLELHEVPKPQNPQA